MSESTLIISKVDIWWGSQQADIHYTKIVKLLNHRLEISACLFIATLLHMEVFKEIRLISFPLKTVHCHLLHALPFPPPASSGCFLITRWTIRMYRIFCISFTNRVNIQEFFNSPTIIAHHSSIVALNFHLLRYILSALNIGDGPDMIFWYSFEENSLVDGAFVYALINLSALQAV